MIFIKKINKIEFSYVLYQIRRSLFVFLSFYVSRLFSILPPARKIQRETDRNIRRETHGKTEPRNCLITDSLGVKDTPLCVMSGMMIWQCQILPRGVDRKPAPNCIFCALRADEADVAHHWQLEWQNWPCYIIEIFKREFLMVWYGCFTGKRHLKFASCICIKTIQFSGNRKQLISFLINIID